VSKNDQANNIERIVTRQARSQDPNRPTVSRSCISRGSPFAHRRHPI